MSVVRSLRVATAAAALVLAASAVSSTPAVAAPGTPAPGCVSSFGRSLVVATVPLVPRFEFRVGDRRYRTDRSGTAVIDPVTCPEPGQALVPITTRIDRPRGKVATFDGWSGADLLARERGDGTLYATFDQEVRVELKLVDLSDRRVARETVGTIVIKGSTGGAVEVPPGESSVVLDATRVVRRGHRLVSRDALWSVQSADVEGNTAVNRGQVRFKPRQTRTVRVPLMLYELRVAVRDVLLHRTVGEQVVLSSPDGSQRTVRLDSDGEAEIRALARGHYVLRVGGASIAMAFDQPVAVSRSAEADLSVISYVDVGIAGGAFLTVVVGLLLAGWRLHRRAGRPRNAPHAAAGLT